MPEKRKKLLWQIFPLFLFITIISLVAVTWYSTAFFKNFFLENSEQELTIRAELVKSVVKDETFAKTDALCKVIGKKTGTRVTVILPTGVVIGDSFGIISGMENHRTRPEVGLALKGERGVSVRYSETVEKNMMYIALPIFKNGQISSVVRVAVSVSTIDNEIKNIQKNIFWALLITVFAASGISLFVSRRITRPLEEMNSGAHYFAKGDLTHRLAIPDSRELAKLAITMNQMAETLDEKIKTVESRSMELEAVYTSMRDGVIAVDRDEKIITFNRAAAKIFDVPASTLKEKNIYGIARNYDLQKFLKKALNNASTFEDDIVIQRDKEYLFHVHSTPLYNLWKKQMGTLVIFHDITRIRHLETMQKDFAANVSHELKTPLTSVKGFVETLQDLMEEKEFSKNGLSFLNIIEKNVNRLIALIDDLLVLSKLERKQGGDIIFQRHDITQIISRAVDTCQREIDQRKVAILCRYLKADSCKTLTAPVEQPVSTSMYQPVEPSRPESVDPYIHQPVNQSTPQPVDPLEPLTAPVDPLLMEQAIVNLLSNAVKYSNQGGEVHISAYLENGFAIIKIRDFGPGINQEHLTKIFQRFYRVDRARSRDLGGTGLGLAIVKHIVQYHKGTINVNSIPCKGSTFEIRIPIS